MIEKNSLILAPMEGITDRYYRELIHLQYPDWDIMACDFLRIPSTGIYPEKHVLKHFGKEHYENPILRNKTIFQVLASDKSYSEQTLIQLKDLGFQWVDLNLGCPSKTVCKRFGGSYLLSDPKTLEQMIKQFRENFPHFFSVKMRVGFHDDKNFETCLKIFEAQGVDSITIHGRTREQLYKGRANWDYIKKAVKLVKTPIIGNGDIWNIDDIEKIFDHTNCHAVMIARGALKNPWLAKSYKEKRTLGLEQLSHLQSEFFLNYKKILIKSIDENRILRRFKSLARYMFEDNPTLRGHLLRADSLAQFMQLL